MIEQTTILPDPTQPALCPPAPARGQAAAQQEPCLVHDPALMAPAEASAPELALTPETRWLLAVRDHRDRAAYAQLFNHFAPRLKAMLLRGGLRDGRAEDVVQDVMLAVWNKAGQFDPHRAAASAWIYRIARNRHIDLMRASPAVEADLLVEPADLEPDAGQILEMEQEHKRLRAAIASLAPEQHALLQRAYFQEMSHSEISADTGLPLGTIKSRIRLGLARLRRELTDLRQP